MDYGGEQPGGKLEGITFFDHPSNPGHPTHWHVRDDGWMGASASFAGPKLITKTEPLTLRYLLHAHRGLIDPTRAGQVFQQFAKRSAFKLIPRPARNTALGVSRTDGPL